MGDLGHWTMRQPCKERLGLFIKQHSLDCFSIGFPKVSTDGLVREVPMLVVVAPVVRGKGGGRIDLQRLNHTTLGIGMAHGPCAMTKRRDQPCSGIAENGEAGLRGRES